MNAPLRFHALAQRAQNRDPTQTLMIRRRYEAEVNKRFRALKGAIRASIVDRDVFGLTQPRPFRPLGNADQTSFSPLPERAFQFSTMPEKVDGFMTWLEDQQSQGLLEISSRRQLGHAANSQWQNVYLQSAYQKGVSRARLEMQKAGVSMPIADQGNIKESVSAAFNRPFHADRVGSIYARAYNELKGVTQAMDTAISRALSDGLLAGKGPLDIARDINKQVDGIGIARARLIARTETIRAHHVATIQEYRNAGVLGIKVKAEWLTAGDSRVCAECAALQGRVFTLDEIEPLIPLHPQCRCVALPVDVTDEEEERAPPAATIEEQASDDPFVSQVRKALGDEAAADYQAFQAQSEEFFNALGDQKLTTWRSIQPGWSHREDVPEIFDYFDQNMPDVEQYLNDWQGDPSSPRGLAVQMLMAQINERPMVWKRDSIKNLYEERARGLLEDKEVVNQILHLRAFNQVYMKKAGIREVELWRGIGGEKGNLIAKSFFKEGYHRTKFSIVDASVSGYSSDRSVSAEFGLSFTSPESGFLMRRTAPAQDVVLHEDLLWRITEGHSEEREHWVLSGERTVVSADDLFVRAEIGTGRTISLKEAAQLIADGKAKPSDFVGE